MTKLHARSALLHDGWQENVRITLDAGRVAGIEIGVAAEAGDERHEVLVPAMPNLHSHAFQRAMAGLAEVRARRMTASGAGAPSCTNSRYR